MHTSTVSDPCHTIDLFPLLESVRKGSFRSYSELETVPGTQYVPNKHFME